MIYRKVGRRYEPVGHEWHGFPMQGIWLVTGSAPPFSGTKTYRWSGTHIMKLGELPALFPFASMAVSREELAVVITKATSGSSYSPMSVADAVLKWMAEKK
jgi:hypothetical protein